VEIIPGAVYPVYRLVITGVAIVAGMLLYFLITRTRIGALIRAGSDNREIVAALGINISLLYTLVFALSAMLAALAGIMMGPLLSVEPGIGDPILITTLVVVVIGGIGSVRGALVGALMVGLFDTLSRVLIPLVFTTNATSALVNIAIYVLEFFDLPKCTAFRWFPLYVGVRARSSHCHSGPIDVSCAHRRDHRADQAVARS